MVIVVNAEDGTAIKSSTLRPVDFATQKYEVFPKTYLKLQIPGTGKVLSLSEVVIVGTYPVAVIASSVDLGRNPNLIINGVIDGKREQPIRSN